MGNTFVIHKIPVLHTDFRRIPHIIIREKLPILFDILVFQQNSQIALRNNKMRIIHLGKAFKQFIVFHYGIHIIKSQPLFPDFPHHNQFVFIVIILLFNGNAGSVACSISAILFIFTFRKGRHNT